MESTHPQEPNFGFCSNCGTPLGCGQAFCMNCGTPVSQPEPVPSPEAILAPVTEPAAAYVPILCTNCRTELMQGQAFCPNCGMSASQPVLNPEQLERIQQAEAQVLQDQERLQQEIQNAEGQKQKKKRKKKVLLAVTISLAVVIILGCVGVFFGIPYANYLNACDILESGDYDAAYTAFMDLGDFLDSQDMANEALYRKATAALSANNYDQALSIFERLGSYKDSKEQLQETKYRQAVNCKNSKLYAIAYSILLEIDGYKDSHELLGSVISLWQKYLLEAGSRPSVLEFSEDVDLQSEHYAAFYSTIQDYLNTHTSAAFWTSWEGTSAIDSICTMLQMLPTDYNDTTNLLRLLNLLRQGNGSSLFRDNLSLVEQYWSYNFVQELAQTDDYILYFLEGYWETSDGWYYLYFYKESGSTRCEYNLPRPIQPSATKYYDIESGIFVWEDANNNVLTRVYRITVINYDTIRVYCYQNGSTYTLHR